MQSVTKESFNNCSNFKQLLRSVSPNGAVFIGNVLDHFDASIYIFLVPVMAPVFFPNPNSIIKLILAYSVLITVAITKPIGAMIFGLLASFKSPLFALCYSLIGVAITTVMIGCLPDYNTIGYAAPCGLIIIKLLREIFSAGESTVAKLYLVENQSESSALQSSCLYNVSSILGIILASIAATVVINNGSSHAWRGCFMIGGMVGLVGFFMRRYLAANTIISLSNADRAISIFLPKKHYFTCLSLELYKYIFKSIWQHKIKILQISLVIGFGHITYAIAFIFFNVLVPIVTDVSLERMLGLNNFLLVIDLIMLLIAGRIIIKFRSDKILLLSSFILSISVIPLFVMLRHASLLGVAIINLWIIFWGVIFSIPVNIWCQKLLANSPEKYFLMGVANSLGAGIIGKTTTAVGLYLWYKTNNIVIPAIYITILMLITFTAIALELMINFSAIKLNQNNDSPISAT
jgi:MFS family permease